MTNYEKLLGLITPAVMAEIIDSNSLGEFNLCRKCEKDHLNAKDISVGGRCEYEDVAFCPFVDDPGLILDFLNEEAEGFSFKEFLDRKLKLPPGPLPQSAASPLPAPSEREPTPSVASGDSSPTREPTPSVASRQLPRRWRLKWKIF